jgi:hypothetical protein
MNGPWPVSTLSCTYQLPFVLLLWLGLAELANLCKVQITSDDNTHRVRGAIVPSKGELTELHPNAGHHMLPLLSCHPQPEWMQEDKKLYCYLETKVRKVQKQV